MTLPLFKRHYSLSIKLISLFVVMTVLFVVIIGSTMTIAFRNHFRESIQPHLVQYLEYLLADIGTPPDLDKARELNQKLAVDIQISGPQQQWSSMTKPIDLNAIKYRRHFRKNTIRYGIGEYLDKEYLVAQYPDYTVAFSIPHNREHWHRNILGPLLLLVLMLTILFVAIRRLFSPIQQIKNGIEKIGKGELEHRIQIKRHDELGSLALRINRMADDISQILEAKRQLLLAISHELRSPLTRAKVSVALLEDNKQRNEINHDLTEMDELISELLETERLSNRHQSLNKEQASISQLIDELLSENFKQTVFDKNPVDGEISANIDVMRIKLLLKNLLNNAITHSLAQSKPPQISLSLIAKEVVITVRDFGVGIEPQHLPHITEPFYRADPARQRQTGGYGLGLYLCRMIAEAHGGYLTINSTPGKGTEVQVHLPQSQPV